jgi:flagellar hook-associated protein 2
VQTRLSNLKDDYTNQFNRLNVTLASMQSTQSYLTQQLASLAKSS